tara:strand:+ start:228 stop:563 length:336 start_codon:yes stop_codon:yes gene_type:complete
MAAGIYDIVIDQGADFSIQLELANNGSAVNLTNFTARAQLRPTPRSSELAGSFTINFTDRANGTLKMEMTNSTTAGLTPGKYYYDLETVSGGGVVTRLLQGIARVTPNVTR